MCSEAHQRDPRNTNVLRDRAEAYILNQDYEKGERAPLIGHLLQKTPLHSPMLCCRCFAFLDKVSMVLKPLYLYHQSGDATDFSFNSACVLSTAVEDYQEAREFDDNQEIREGLERAQKLLKISRKRDYYKILGVSR